MYPDSQEHEWDTPPNGDFVRYVERLTASASAAHPASAPTSAIPQAGAAKKLPLLNQWAALLFSVLHNARTANTTRSGLERLQQELRSLAQQRQHEKRKNEN